MNNLNRRDFLFSAAAFCAAGCVEKTVGKPDGGTYSVVLIGDTHFDSPDPLFYHAKYLSDTTKRRFDAHKREHVRNAEMWKERLPRLLKAAGKCRRSDAAFILQMGDLVQGDCGDGEIHRQMLLGAVDAVKRAIPDTPFVTVCGNHDIRGKGAQIAYNRLMPGLISRELGVPVDRTTFSFRQGPDVFIVADFNVKETVEPGEDYERILQLLDESRDARRTFVVSHGPFITTTRWSLLGSRKRDMERMELTRRLAARNAIVLAGHTHKTEYDDCQFPEGRIQQVVLNSVWTKDRGSALELLHDRPEQFLGSMKGMSKQDKEKLLAFTEDRRRALKHYWMATTACHAQLEVSDTDVLVSFYPGDSLECARRQVM